MWIPKKNAFSLIFFTESMNCFTIYAYFFEEGCKYFNSIFKLNFRTCSRYISENKRISWIIFDSLCNNFWTNFKVFKIQHKAINCKLFSVKINKNAFIKLLRIEIQSLNIDEKCFSTEINHNFNIYLKLWYKI